MLLSPKFRVFIIISFLFLSVGGRAQSVEADSVVRLSADDSVRLEKERLGLILKREKSNPKYVLSLQTLADDIVKKQPTDSMKLWTLMDWMVANLKYDATINNSTENKSVSELAEYAIKYKKGNSAHFAAMFAHVANLMNIQSLCVDGYARDAVNAFKGKMKVVTNRDTIPYHWCLCKVDSVYHAFDPTLAVDWKTMIKKYNDQEGSFHSFNPRYFYFCENSLYFRDQRLAFDPLLQIDSFPRSFSLFDERSAADSSRVFKGDYTNLIDDYLQKDDIRQKIECLERMKKNGEMNSCVAAYAESLKFQVDQFFYQEALLRKSRGEKYFSDAQTIKNGHAVFTLQNELKSALSDAIKCYKYANQSFDSLRSVRFKVRAVKEVKSINGTLLVLNNMYDNLTGTSPFDPELSPEALVFPKDALKSTARLASFLQGRFETDTLRLWALMDWMAKNIQYDYNAQALPAEKTKGELADLTLKKRTGGNEGFEALFSQVASQMGVPTVSVLGYSYDQMARREKDSHVWTICKLGDYYHMFDPALAAIEIDSAKKVTFVPSGKTIGLGETKFSLGHYVFKDIVVSGAPRYFMCEDNNVHRARFCAYDPLMQLTQNPLNCSDFEIKTFSFPSPVSEPEMDSTKIYYYKWVDMLDNYVEKDDLLRRVECLARMEKNGTPNKWVQDYMNSLRKSIDNTRFNDASELMKSARKYYKEALSGNMSSAAMARTLFESSNEILAKMMTLSYKNKANAALRENNKAIADLNKKMK